MVFALVYMTTRKAYEVHFRAVQMAGPTRTAMIMNLEPVISILLSVVILMETITNGQSIGAILVLTAVLVSQITGNRPQTADV
ncbi:MAG: EamA family transporter [Hyphomicrobiales bacterium]|nr:EamA family transporter [Hyphomicrobiales bacterium]